MLQHDFILLDRSGSMGGDKWIETIGAVNSYVKALVANAVDTGVTLAVFDANHNTCDFEIIRDRIVPATWRDVDPNEAPPRGWTPLNDAIGKLIDLARAGQPGSGAKYDRVTLTILTDGQENHSREYSHAKAKELIAACKKDGWVVTFIGCDFDNAQQAQGYAVAAQHTVGASVANTGAVFRSLGAKRGDYGATGLAESMDFMEVEKVALASAKPVSDEELKRLRIQGKAGSKAGAAPTRSATPSS